MRAGNLARALVGLGAAAAEPLYQNAIATGETALGADHPPTHRFPRRRGDAVGQAALAAHAEANGPNHPWTKDSARVVAEAFEAHGRADEAAAVRH